MSLFATTIRSPTVGRQARSAAQQHRPGGRQPEVCLLFDWTAATSAAVLRPFLKYPDAQVYVNTR